MQFKTFLCLASGALGAVVAHVFGGWSDCLTVLLILMALDYLSGLVVAGIFHKSPKSKTGALESHAGLKGLMRKFAVICTVVAAHLIDRLLGTNYLRDACAIAFCLNEVISLVENAGLMGVKLPKVLTKAIDVLRQKSGEDEQTAAGEDGGELVGNGGRACDAKQVPAWLAPTDVGIVESGRTVAAPAEVTLVEEDAPDDSAMVRGDTQ